MEIAQETITVTTVGADGAAAGSNSFRAAGGFLLDFYFDFADTAPATTDTTVAFDEPDLGNLLVISNAVTDGLIAPRQKFVDNANAAITNSHGMFALNGKVTVTLAQSNALAPAVTVRMRYLRL